MGSKPAPGLSNPNPTPIVAPVLATSLATLLGPMLLAVAVFSLNLLSQIKNADQTHVDELLAILTAICLLGSATSADSVMDAFSVSTRERLTYLGFGYLLFCLAIGILTAAVPIIYAEVTGFVPIATWRYWLFGLTGIAAAVKPMLWKERSWTAVMFIFYGLSLIASAGRSF